MSSKADDIQRRKSLTVEQRQAKAAKTIASLKRDGLTTSLKTNDDDPDGSAAAAAADAILSKPALAMGPRHSSPDEGELHEDGQEMEPVEADAGKSMAKRETPSSERAFDNSPAAPETTTPRTTRQSSKRSSDQSAPGSGTAGTSDIEKEAKALPPHSADNAKQPKTSIKLKIRPKQRESGDKSRKSGVTSSAAQLPKSTPLLTTEQATNAQKYRQSVKDLGDRMCAASPDGTALTLGLFETTALQLVKAELGLKALLQDYPESIANKGVPPTEDGGDGTASKGHHDKDDHGDCGPHTETESAALDDNGGLSEVPVNVAESAAETVGQSVPARGEVAEAKTTPGESSASLPSPSKDAAPDAGSAVEVIAARKPEAATGDTTADEAVLEEAADEGVAQHESVPQKATQKLNRELQIVEQKDIDAAERATDGRSHTAINEAVISGVTNSQPSDRDVDRSPKRAIDQVEGSDESLPAPRSPKQARHQVESEQPSTTQSVEPAALANLTNPAAVTSYVAGLLSTLGQYTAASIGQPVQNDLEISPTHSTGDRPSDALAEMHDTVEHEADEVGGAGIKSGDGADASPPGIV
ncbi:hypothetical protein LTR91_001780 [Friedmanniomyces endolithicus]|uniref:Uncharacterized protein n=1 Tax=Friedmanniomyces endolithicus TaxID=329885 RepID=A0AAN6FUX2_9PEZI|nr:hypothetical protein LTR35_003955 [Friedmanniomyces endolithicus]KAK0300227.1 hypothetical protein LTS00_001299 [Friedmanniomyces endolithicus]KAK0324972.1 hypothetical protein LTR82_003958 [Friedmanniomyces endolithicus]KAK0999999.1 hypothetical protein LTR54_008922 [Friedmanniomyces endolithicus]KAK1004655.1 hypothetical protein LTS01_003665 [Friedmanniomyces endolithicus]